MLYCYGKVFSFLDRGEEDTGDIVKEVLKWNIFVLAHM